MDQDRIFMPDIVLELTDGLQERLTFDIADRTATSMIAMLVSSDVKSRWKRLLISLVI